MNNDKEHQFELLVRQHKRTIYTVCYMFSHNKAEIDDLFQEILIRLWNGFDPFDRLNGLSQPNKWRPLRRDARPCVSTEPNLLHHQPDGPDPDDRQHHSRNHAD